MEENIQKLYDWSLSNNHIPTGVTFEQFSAKVSDPAGLRAYYDALSASPVQGSQYGAAGADWESFQAAYSVKKKESGPSPSLPGSPTSSSSAAAPAQSVAQPSAPEQAPWDQVAALPVAESSAPPQLDLSNPETFSQVGQEDRQGIGPFSQPLTGDEDPIAFGESLRATLPNYEYRKIYEGRTPLRKAGRDMANIASYGEQARKQTMAAEKALTEKFGPTWQQTLENTSTILQQMQQNLSLENPMDQAAYNKAADAYNAIVSDPSFQNYQAGLKAQQRGYNEFMGFAEKNPELKKSMTAAQAAQARADFQGKAPIPEILQLGLMPGQGGGTQNWAMRKASQLLGGALSLPRTIGGAFPEGWVDQNKWRLADELGSIGDELVESANINYPKPSSLKTPLYQSVAKFEGKKVVVDGKGNPVSATDENGKPVDMAAAAEGQKSFEQRFKESGAGEKSSLEFSGSVAGTLDKVVDAAADLMIYRYLGQGTKPGVIASSMALGHQQAYQEAMQELKMTPHDAAEYAFFSSLGVGALEAYVGNIETAFAKPAVAEAIRLGKAEAMTVAGKMGAAKAAAVRFKPVMKEIAGENAEELLQSISVDTTRAAYNKMTGAEMDMEFDKKTAAETALITTLVTAPAALAGIGANVNQYRMSALTAAVQNPDQFNRIMGELLDNGVISEEESASLQGQIARLAAYSSNLPENLSVADRGHVLALQSYREVQDRIANSDQFVDAQRQQAREEVKYADQMIGKIIGGVSPQTGAEEATTDTNETVVQNEVQVEAPAVQEPAQTPIPEVFPAEQTVADLVSEAQPAQTPPEVIVRQESDTQIATEVQSDPAQPDVQPIQDRITQAAVGLLEQKGMDVQPEQVQAVAEFVVPEMTDPNQINDPNEPANVALDRITDEYMIAQGVTPEPIRSIDELKVDRKAEMTRMDERLGEEGQASASEFFDAVGTKFSVANAAIQSNSPEWQEFEQRDPQAAAIVKEAFTNVSIINEKIANAERRTAQQPGEAGPITEQANAPAEQNVGQIPASNQDGQVQVGDDAQGISAGDTVTQGSEIATQPVTTPERTEQVSQAATTLLAEAPLPEQSTESTATQMIDAGAMTEQQAVAEQSDLPSADPAPENMEGLREDQSGEQADMVDQGIVADINEAHDPEQVLARPMYAETETEFVVQAPDHRDMMRDLGGRWVTGRGWVFPINKKYRVLRAIASRPGNPTIDDTRGATSTMAGRIGAAFRSSTIYRLASQRRQRIAKGRTLEDRLRIARQEIAISDDARERKNAKVRELLATAFPGVEVVTDPAIFKMVARAYFPDIDPPLGFAFEGKVYYDIERIGVEVQIHEFGHIHNSLMKKHNPALFERGLETVKGSEYEAAVRDSGRYENLSDEDILEEALALAIGERGARIMNATRWQRFQDFLNDLWLTFKRVIGFDGIGMRAHEYADLIAAKMLSGKEIFAESSEEIARIEKQAKAMFIGDGANLSAQAKVDLDMAKMLERDGRSNHEIWLATNWRRDVDGKWKFEIADGRVLNKIEPQLVEAGEVYFLKDVLDHPELFEAYPFIGDIAVVMRFDEDADYAATVAKFEGSDEIVLGINLADPFIKYGQETFIRTLLHEAQHFIQIHENFGIGASVQSLDGLIDGNVRVLSDLYYNEDITTLDREKIVDSIANIVNNLGKSRRDIYNRVSGEVEARNVEFRSLMKQDQIRESYPPTTEDVAPEEQVVLFLTEEAIQESVTPGFEHEGELLAGTTPHARAKFGSEALRNQATRAAAIQIIELEITQGSTPRDQAIPLIAAQLGLDQAYVDQLWDEAERRVGGKALRIDLSERGVETASKRIKKWFARQFSYKGLLPRGVFREAQKIEQGISGVMYRAKKQANDLDAAFKAHATKNNSPKADQVALRELTHAAMEGTADWSMLPEAIAERAQVLRATLDDLSRQLLLSGAFPPSSIITVMERMGVRVDDWTEKGQYDVVLAALGKPPYERTDEENLLVDGFIAAHQRAFGTYVNRSYRVHSYPDWIERIPQDVWNRAKGYYLKEFAKRRVELEALVGSRDTKSQEKLDKLSKERDIVRRAIEGIVSTFDEKVQAVIDSMDKPFEGNPMDIDHLAEAVDNATDLIGKIKEELKFMFNVENMDVAEIDAMIGPNAEALQGLLNHLRRLNHEIMEVEVRIEANIEMATKELDIINNNMADINRFMRQELVEQSDGLDVTRSGNGQVGAKPTSITKKRKDLPEEIRALYGEYKDPVINFMQSAYKMSQLLESQNFLNRLRQRYEGVYFFKDGKQPSNAYVRISAEGNARMAPMDGFYTTPDIALAMQDFYGSENVAEWQKWWAMQIANKIKLGKTILSPVTQMRNFWGNTSFLLANAWNPFRAFQALNEYKASWSGSKEEWRTYAERLHSLGVFGNSVNAKDVEALRDAISLDTMPDDYGQFVEGTMSTATGALKRLPKNAYEVAQKTYELGDAFWKIMGFENEKRRYARAWFGKPFDDLTPQERDEVEQRAALIVKTVLPTYSYVPKIVKTIRRVPFVGTFVAFPAEMVRVTYNTYVLGIQEMKDPRTKAIGALRLAGASAAVSASYFVVLAAKAICGYDDDEWDDANKFVSEFQKNSMLMPLPRDEQGNMRFINLGYTDPFAFLSKIINAGFDDPTKPPAGRAVDMLMEFAGPFVSPELTFDTATKLFYNVDDRGNQIRSSAFKDELFGTEWLAEQNMKRQLAFAAKKLQPGISKSVWDAYDIMHVNADKSGRIKEWSDFALAHAFGLNIERIDPRVSYTFQAKAYMKERNDARASYTALQGQLNRSWKSLEQKLDDMSPEARAARITEFDRDAEKRLKEQYVIAKSAYLRILKEANRTTTALMRLGVSDADVRDILKEAKFGQKNNEINAIISGNYDSVIFTFNKKERY